MTAKARVTTRKGMDGVVCRCGNFKMFGAYAIAQMAMRHTLDRETDCCNRIISVAYRGRSYVIVADIQSGKAPAK